MRSDGLQGVTGQVSSVPFERQVPGSKKLRPPARSTVSSFSIARRRMVVPIYKKWEATSARIQIVSNEKSTQLLAFFSDFSHGKCMNFVLKGTDTLETFSRSGKYGIRIVDAKFALPKTDNEPAADFVCLDMPDYAIEHDDVVITFDAEEGMHHLCWTLLWTGTDLGRTD